jgi:hypothetical protein
MAAMKSCTTGKNVYASQALAEDALLEAYTRSDFPKGQGPVTVYVCNFCSSYHLTSKGPMNPRLAAALSDGTLKRLREAAAWERKLRR